LGAGRGAIGRRRWAKATRAKVLGRMGDLGEGGWAKGDRAIGAKAMGE
jgi:hypothetical protein